MFWTRLISGVLLLIAAILTMSLGGVPLMMVLLAISLIAYRELTKVLGCAGDGGKLSGPEIVGYTGIAIYYFAAYAVADLELNYVYLLAVIMGVFLAELFVYVLSFPKFVVQQIEGAVFSFVYAPVMLGFVLLTRELPQGIYLVWLILISSWGCDTCAYAVGMVLGKKKIFPVLSPKKTLEGCIGGVLGAALIGGVYGHLFVQAKIPDRPVAWLIAIICAVGAVMSMVGDLAASAIKRNHSVKDYGNLIPGHGGIMDRFDSMIITAPMVYFLAELLLQNIH